MLFKFGSGDERTVTVRLVSDLLSFLSESLLRGKLLLSLVPGSQKVRFTEVAMDSCVLVSSKGRITLYNWKIIIFKGI